MQWCYTPGFTDPTNVITCQQWAQEVFASRNATIANWLYYDYNEVDQIGPIRSSPSLADQAYGSSLIACPEIELRINTCVPQLHSCDALAPITLNPTTFSHCLLDQFTHLLDPRPAQRHQPERLRSLCGRRGQRADRIL